LYPPRSLLVTLISLLSIAMTMYHRQICCFCYLLLFQYSICLFFYVYCIAIGNDCTTFPLVWSLVQFLLWSAFMTNESISWYSQAKGEKCYDIKMVHIPTLYLFISFNSIPVVNDIKAYEFFTMSK
jgi:hypothetical protein